MRTAGNVIWFVLGGWWTALIWLLGAFLFAVTIIGLPLTRSAIEMAKLTAWPFGKEVVHIRDLDQRKLSGVTALTGTIGFVVNVIWACTFGILLFCAQLFAGIVVCFTIIGIPFGLQSFKIAALSFWPVGRRVVSVETAAILRQERAQATIAKFRAKGSSAVAVNTPEIVP